MNSHISNANRNSWVVSRNVQNKPTLYSEHYHKNSSTQIHYQENFTTRRFLNKPELSQQCFNVLSRMPYAHKNMSNNGLEFIYFPTSRPDCVFYSNHIGFIVENR